MMFHMGYFPWWGSHKMKWLPSLFKLFNKHKNSLEKQPYRQLFVSELLRIGWCHASKPCSCTPVWPRTIPVIGSSSAFDRPLHFIVVRTEAEAGCKDNIRANLRRILLIISGVWLPIYSSMCHKQVAGKSISPELPGSLLPMENNKDPYNLDPMIL